ncbi:MAG: hypothetical protein ABF624_00215 [Liquorilactobacillus ghanensis]|uniref:hypothetical protein n=1 Tax=Liquorilactobacillus ghanensis TaxID=399370 RepID=UPI0039EC092B
MLVYEKDGKILSEEQYNKLTEGEFKNDVDAEAKSVEDYRETDSDFTAYDFDYLNDFGDFDIYTSIEDGSGHDAILIKYHDNVNQHDSIVLIKKSDTANLLSLSDDYDDAEDGDQKGNVLMGINDILGLN